MTAPYEVSYALDRLDDAIKFAQAEGDFGPAAKWLLNLRDAIRQEEETPAEHLLDIYCVRYAGCN